MTGPFQVTFSPRRHIGNQGWRLRCPEYSGYVLHIGICNSKTGEGGKKTTKFTLELIFLAMETALLQNATEKNK